MFINVRSAYFYADKTEREISKGTASDAHPLAERAAKQWTSDVRFGRDWCVQRKRRKMCWTKTNYSFKNATFSQQASVDTQGSNYCVRHVTHRFCERVNGGEAGVK